VRQAVTGLQPEDSKGSGKGFLLTAVLPPDTPLPAQLLFIPAHMRTACGTVFICCILPSA
jgi:hypothetical protein